MTDNELEILADFYKWCADPFDEERCRTTVPDGYEKVPPGRVAWDLSDIGITAPPFEPVPCRKCGEPSDAKWRTEFKREHDEPTGRGWPHGWDIGISLFIYECPTHGYFANEAQERGYGTKRNGHRVTIS